MDIQFGIANGKLLQDVFKGIVFNWTFDEVISRRSRMAPKKCYTLSVRKEHKQIVREYLKSILNKQGEHHGKRLLTNVRKEWVSTTALRYAATFDTIAMDSAKKEALKSDLDAFMKGEEYYSRTGQPWKRGYLLYGRKGTGKSSLISAIAKVTSYDVYDLQITKVSSNKELRKLLIQVQDRSIVAVEDIDHFKELANGSSRRGGRTDASIVTLAGLLDFIDGLWSACRKEIIFIFTAESRNAAFPVSLRLDYEIGLSCCNGEMFRTLAERYLGLTNHRLFAQADELLRYGRCTPAEMAKVMLKHRSEPADEAMNELIEHLNSGRP